METNYIRSSLANAANATDNVGEAFRELARVWIEFEEKQRREDAFFGFARALSITVNAALGASILFAVAMIGGVA